ncbi:restriction endonuclease subunit S [Shewanella algae]|uniref:restriction endonuclease subunit S n=2 Tax=Shewanella algae TaxID=38313 RepID=UPI00313D93C2
MVAPNFPPEWAICSFSDLVLSSFTGLVRSAREQGDERNYNYLKMNNLDNQGNFLLDDLTKVNAEPIEVQKYSLQRGDFIFNTRNSAELVGKCGVFSIESTEPILFNNNLLKVNFIKVDPRIVALWLNSPLGKRDLRAITSATTSVAAIYQKQLFGVVLPLPPLAEQKVIADKLDTLLAQVESTKARLERIPDILKRFRQSVLSAAMSGKLTEKWRETNECVSVVKYLKAIEQERIKLINAKKLKKSVLPRTSIEQFVSDLPSSWSRVHFEHIAAYDGNALKAGPFGSALKKSDCTSSGFRVYGQEQVIAGDESLVTYYINEAKFDALSSCAVKSGDILVSLVGTIGKVMILSDSAEKGIINPRLVKLSLQPEINRRYIQFYLQSIVALDFFKGFSHGGTMDILNLSILKDLPINLPPIEEQTEIVRRVEELFAFADIIEQKATAALERVNNLTQSILAKAFRGELTADWRAANPELISGENSAEALLESIKNERAKHTNKKRNKTTQ